MASGKVHNAILKVSRARSALTSETTQRTEAAVAVTERLSSRSTGRVSTAAAAAAAANPPTTGYHQYAGGTTFSRHHHARTAALSVPKITNARHPPADLRGFHGIRAIGSRRPTSVAMPSPAARMPHDAATMSRRFGKSRSKPTIDNG